LGHFPSETQMGSLARRSVLRAPGPVDPAVDGEFDPDMVRAPKRLRHIAVRDASLPTAAVASRSRRAERLAQRKREKVLRRAASGVTN
jgi:hypothetical protein